MFTFSKNERLNNKRMISYLFQKGNSFFIYPFSVKWSVNNSESKQHSNILIGIPKRNFKKAVERNKLKRLIREAYRLNKHVLTDKIYNTNSFFVFSIIYTEKEIVNFKVIQEKIILILLRLLVEHEKNNS